MSHVGQARLISPYPAPVVRLRFVATTTAPSRPASARRTTIALKVLMAGTGLVFVGFVLLHMYGNLKAFAGQDAYNEYADHLRTFGEPMLPVRAACCGSCAWADPLPGRATSTPPSTLWRRAGNARRSPYSADEDTARRTAVDALGRRDDPGLPDLAPARTSPSARSTPRRAARPNDPYHLLVDTFDLWWMTLIYLSRWSRSALHLAPRHLERRADPRLDRHRAAALPPRQGLGYVLAAVIAVGFSLVPLAVLSGIITK